MRIAFLSDIHANQTALSAVLADMAQQHVDRVISLGDTITIGPQPLEVLSILRQLDCVYIKGNHDAAVLDPDRAGEYQITEHLIPDLIWCRDQLSRADHDFINSFQTQYEFTFPNGVSVLCFHGSPRSSTDLIQATTSPEKLTEYLGGFEADVYIGGHSHIQMQRRFGEKLVLNSGSVGNAFKFAYTPGVIPSLLPWAEYAILSQNGDSLDVDLRRVYFDTEKLLKIIMESGLPGKKWWMAQYHEEKAHENRP